MELNMFDKVGKFVMPDLSNVDAETRERFAPVAAAAAELENAERELTAAIKVIEQDVLAIEAAERDLRQFKKPTFHDLWAQTTSRPNKV